MSDDRHDAPRTPAQADAAASDPSSAAATAAGDNGFTAEEVSEQKAVRLQKRERLIRERTDAAGGAYPVQLPITTTIPAVRAEFGHLEADATTGVTVGLAGRLVHLRNTGKLCFASLQSGDGSRIQAMVSLANVGEESLAAWKELVDLGDHVFVTGEVIASRRGELSIMVSDWAIASKALLPLPNLHNELSEESRVRSRYLDLIVRDQARQTVRARAKAVASLRATFDAHDFLELARNQDDRFAFFREFANEFQDFGFGANIDSASRLIQK